MQSLDHHAIPGHVSIVTGNGGLPALRIETALSTAEIYPHGAHVTGFQLKDSPPLLFMSEASEFRPDQPIRGGVPVIFPWFGPREGMATHGFARLAEWDVVESAVRPDGSVRIRFRLPAGEPFEVTFTVTVGRSLTMELAVANTGTTPFTFETCLHTYFQIGDIHQLRVTGLRGERYHDQVLAAAAIETGDAITFTAETDRVYQDTTAPVDIIDPALGRHIRVSKSGSKSTVVWNPWIAKSKRMPDFGDDEYLRMVCVESGNVREHALTLAPGETSVLRVEVESLPLLAAD